MMGFGYEVAVIEQGDALVVRLTLDTGTRITMGADGARDMAAKLARAAVVCGLAEGEVPDITDIAPPQPVHKPLRAGATPVPVPDSPGPLGHRPLRPKNARVAPPRRPALDLDGMCAEAMKRLRLGIDSDALMHTGQMMCEMDAVVKRLGVYNEFIRATTGAKK